MHACKVFQIHVREAHVCVSPSITNKTEHFSFKGGHAMQVAKYTVGKDCHVSDDDAK